MLGRHQQPRGVPCTATNGLDSGRSPMVQPGPSRHNELLGPLEVKPLGSCQVEGLCDCDGVSLAQDRVACLVQDVHYLAVVGVVLHCS